MIISTTVTHLQDHANKNEAFVSALRTSCLPPEFETPNPVLQSAAAFALSLVQRLVVLFSE